MNIALISSTMDPASVNIKTQLLQLHSFEKLDEDFEEDSIYSTDISGKKITLYTIKDALIHANGIDQKIDADVFIFLSKHRAEEGRASLTVHPIGNFGEAAAGGISGKLCSCPCSIFKELFKALSSIVEGTEYETTLEATHHGPFLEKPVLFLELGSNETHWNDPNGAELLSKALLNALSVESKEYETTILLGGSHYSHVGNKVMLLSDHAMSHMMPKYNFDRLDSDMLLQMIEKTVPRPEFVLLDWKGLGSYKDKIFSVLEEAGIEHKRSDHFFKGS